MNNIFLEMIVSDPEQGGTIQKAEINKDFDILVYGPNDKMLNPRPRPKWCFPTSIDACLYPCSDESQ